MYCAPHQFIPTKNDVPIFSLSGIPGDPVRLVGATRSKPGRTRKKRNCPPCEITLTGLVLEPFESQSLIGHLTLIFMKLTSVERYHKFRKQLQKRPRE